MLMKTVVAIEEEKKGSALVVTTNDRVKYVVVVTDPKMHYAALFSRNDSALGDFALCRIMGSLPPWCDSLMDGVIAVGSCMFVWDSGDVSGEIIRTAPVARIWPLPPWVSVKDIVAKAEADFHTTVIKTIEQEFPDAEKEVVRILVNHFDNQSGKSMVLGALVYANKCGKLQEAACLMERYWAEFWGLEPPEVAGDPIIPGNQRAWEKFYGDIRMPMLPLSLFYEYQNFYAPWNL